jgi:predicted secreted hydrolase
MHARAAYWGVFVLVGGLGGCGSDGFYEITAAEPPVQLPDDEAPHCYGGEWWYYTGRLVTENGHGYGLEAVIFHDAHVPLLLLTEGWAAHFAVLDETSGTFTYDQTRWLGPASFNCRDGGSFDLFTPLVQMTGSQGRDHLRAVMFDGAYAVDLVLEDQSGPVLHGDRGLVPYGQHGNSFYYSRPVMLASGTLQDNGRPHPVSGYLWFDRQWGQDLSDPWLPWDWFSLRLDDGTNVMLFTFRDTTPPVSFGTLMSRTDEPRHLDDRAFAITPTAFWTSPHTGATYPVSWDIEVIPHELSLAVTALVADQELDVRATTLNVYWEGMCAVTGTHAGRSVSGVAYVELANYAR